MTEQYITYKPNWRIFRFQFALSFLMIPLIVGVPIFLYYYHKWKKIEYVITNEKIVIHDGEISNISYNDIKDLRIKISPPFLKKSTGDIFLVTKSSSYTLKSILDCDILFDALSSQIQQVLSRQTANSERERMSVKADPGSLERLNDLLGMWQQGLISDEDYWTERNKFEK
jgi:hypothetical protein